MNILRDLKALSVATALFCGSNEAYGSSEQRSPSDSAGLLGLIPPVGPLITSTPSKETRLDASIRSMERSLSVIESSLRELASRTENPNGDLTPKSIEAELKARRLAIDVHRSRDRGHLTDDEVKDAATSEESFRVRVEKIERFATYQTIRPELWNRLKSLDRSTETARVKVEALTQKLEEVDRAYGKGDVDAFDAHYEAVRHSLAPSVWPTIALGAGCAAVGFGGVVAWRRVRNARG